MQIRNELATMNYRSNGDWQCPVVVRVPVGGYIHGSLCHSQSIDGYFTHLPGIMIAYPSNAADAKGLLKAACRMNNPVLFFEHKGLYRQGYASSKEPDKDYLVIDCFFYNLFYNLTDSTADLIFEIIAVSFVTGDSKRRQSDGECSFIETKLCVLGYSKIRSHRQ